MLIITRNKFILCLTLFFLSHFAWSYDKTGHRIIGQIASNHLDKKAKKEIEKLLGKNGIIHDSNWADHVRSNSNFNYANSWHYVNLKDNLTENQLDSIYTNRSKNRNNLLFAIDSLSNRLKNNKSDTIALRFLIHFMEDYHQPLHFGRQSDFGGNKVKLVWFKDSTNLHSIWDSELVEFSKMTYSEYANFLEDHFAANKKNFKEKDLLFSLKKAYQIRSKAYDYNYTKLNPYKYNYAFESDLNYMLYLGGIQLAKVLNDIYK